tara:strand:- start:426 stop:638 length:213 start_codon:yes stop_codon:yes gene_type:complete
MKKTVILCVVGLVLLSCGKSACDCKKESEELISQSLREKFSREFNESEEKLIELDKECAEYTAADYKECK